MSAAFPFSAVVGQHDLRLALLLNAVHPGIGGVLVRGEKGTAKSTVVRALAALLPPVTVADGCRFACAAHAPDPHCPDLPHTGGAHTRAATLAELPVGATEDRVIGSLDLEKALTQGERAYQPGLLAAANRGVLYVDEVNLLHDHLVDLLLDAAAMGRAHVEREGVSISHAARFLLVGTMNPEEGELRPQLLDRFGLTVSVTADREVSTRTEVIKRRLAFEADPNGFATAWASADAKLAARIVAAQEILPSVVLPDAELRRIASVCASFEVDGMRADLVVARTATAHAAWRGEHVVAESDVEVAVRLALPHRRRRDPFDQPGISEDQLQQAMSDAAQDADEPDGPDDPPQGPDGGGAADTEDQTSSGGEHTPQSAPAGDGGERAAGAPDPTFRTRLLSIPGLGEGSPGKRSAARTTGGRLVRADPSRGNGIHLIATLLAAAPHQRERGRSGPGLRLTGHDLRRAIREGKESNLVLFVVDASGSMAARRRMAAVTAAVISLLRDAYQRRDKVGVITFRGAEATVVLPPTNSVDVAVRRLRDLRTGGRTPLAHGLLEARKIAAVERIRDPKRRCLMVLVTDGRATVAHRAGGDPVGDSRFIARQVSADGVSTVVVDCETGPVRLGLAHALATELAAPTLPLEQLSADGMANLVRATRAA